MPRSGIVEPYGSSIFILLRNCRTILQNSCTSLHSHQQCKRVTFSPDPLQPLLFVDFSDDGHYDWCEVIPHGSFHLHSLIISDVDCLFMCLWPSIYLIWRNVYLDLPIFWLGCLFSWHWAAWAVCIFWRLMPCQSLCKYFLLFCSLFFILWFPLLYKSF